MKAQIEQLLVQTVEQLKQTGILPAEAAPRIQVDRTRDKTHGDFATNLAMMLAKPAKKNPRELAQLIIDTLPQSDAVAKVEIAGPGFINFFADTGSLANQLIDALADPNLGVVMAAQPQTVVVDQSSPNLAKEMHVGHLRSTIIGDSVARTLSFLGHKVIRQNHVGDWGTQFGMLLAYMEELRDQEAEISMQLSDLETFYRAAKGRFDDSTQFADRARQLVVELQSGDEYCNRLWREFIDVSLSHCQEVYDRLGVLLTYADVKAESSYNDDLAPIVDELKAKGLLVEDQGAMCAFLDEFKGKDGEALPIIVQKKDGGFLYATTDLAAIRYRANQLNADRVLYFVDARQGLHFQQVFTLAHKAGFVTDRTSLEHMAFGTVMGKDGKPFKTRAGGVAKLADLLSEAERRAYELVKNKNPDMDEETQRHIGRTVGLAAVKYADLSKNRTSDYIFDWDLMISFDGNTAPYLLYAYTRVASIFRKAALDPAALSGSIVLEADQELALANKLAAFNDAVQSVASKGCPHLLCTYLYELAGLFSSFYEACPILNHDDESIKHSRLRLADLTARTLKQGLSLLGIDVLEQM